MVNFVAVQQVIDEKVALKIMELERENEHRVKKAVNGIPATGLALS